MALIKNVILDSGIECPNAYCRVGDVTVSYTEERAWIKVCQYKDKEARVDGKNMIGPSEDFRVYNTEARQSAQAVYNLVLNPVVADSGDTLVFAIGETVLASITEGVDLILVDTASTADTMLQINTLLNDNIEFNQYFESVLLDGDSGTFEIKAKKDGLFDGVTGNDLSIAGTLVATTVTVRQGQDGYEGNFTKFFGIDKITGVEKNVVSQAYEYLKTTEKYINAVDDYS